MAAPVGNTNGARGTRWRDAINKALARYESDKVKAGEALDRIAMNVVEDAVSGNKDAIAEIGNRLDGKPAQALIGGGEGDPPIRSHTEIIIRGVDVPSR